ncbi:MAG: hypothetical protein Q7J80_05470 [Anaerolineales bacterium]|nr:hypothetical protein [Anaerolineales bacterium]
MPAFGTFFTIDACQGRLIWFSRHGKSHYLFMDAFGIDMKTALRQDYPKPGKNSGFLNSMEMSPETQNKHPN